MEFVGPYSFEFNQAVEVLENSDYVKNTPTLKAWNPFSDTCYFLYDDGKYRVEIELNSGTKADKAEEVSVRTNIFKEEGNITKALHLCRILCGSLSLNCWNMKLRRLIDLNDMQDLTDTISHFNRLKNKK
ncbi:hypothetical protein [Paenibacillus contaminans]|uniref:Uncharacterized protein n=1 Tax=Paenibacillus contaminans TaxID=450362 RepID=A0A329LMH2_9BACL|nr:hypothetical protein [Paenibacillus contaminans]RAV09191.1 hypothetical protein DQG23_39875 [Paenibacillus contaminans]